MDVVLSKRQKQNTPRQLALKKSQKKIQKYKTFIVDTDLSAGIVFKI